MQSKKATSVSDGATACDLLIWTSQRETKIEY